MAPGSNVSDALIPFKANLDENVGDVDLLSALCSVENMTPPVTVTNTVSNTSNVILVLKFLFIMRAVQPLFF